MALTSSLAFQKIAGRFKLEAEDEFRSCFGEVAVVAAREAAKRHRDSRLRRLERSQLADLKSDVLVFLKKHGFNCCLEDLRLNMPKKHAFGFRRTYPLHQAVQNQDWPMVKLLLQFGADPTCKDSKGRDLGTCVAEMRAPDWIRAVVFKYQRKASEFFGSAVPGSTTPGPFFIVPWRN